MFAIVYGLVNVFGKVTYALPFYITVGFVDYILMARLLRLFKKEDKEFVLSLFPANYRRIRKIISLLILH